MNIPFSQLYKEIEKRSADFQKNFRLAQYKTLNDLAKMSRQEIINTYPKNFPDEDGIRKNKGVPKQVVFDNKVNKSIPGRPSINIYASDKISFMEKQEFGGDVFGGKSGNKAAIPFHDNVGKMRKGTKGMKDNYTITNVMASLKQAIGNKASSLKGRKKGVYTKKPSPFFMRTESGHRMVAIRLGNERMPIMALYHFDQKRHFREKFNFFKTVEGVVVSSTEKVWLENLKKLLDKK